MGTYSIQQLSTLSGIKAHTIRIWEQRYGLLTPKRSEGNIRIYEDHDLKRLINVALLIGNGFKIAALSKMNKEELEGHVMLLADDSNTDNYATEKVNAIFMAMIDLQARKFENAWDSAIHKLGYRNTILQVIYPFLQKVGLYWAANEISAGKEHFISNLIRQKMISAINDLPLPTHPKKKFLLFLPEQELHELGLLMASYVIRERGHEVIYLGQDVPLQVVEEAFALTKPDVLLLFLTTSRPGDELEVYLRRIHTRFGTGKVLVSGSTALLQTLTLPARMHWLKEIKDIEIVL